MPESERAESYLDSLEPIGWRFGLERMRALCDELGNPQRRYATVHVVGTNAKTSVCRMIEGLLAAGGIAAAGSVSPHLNLWQERISVAGKILPADDFGRAVETVRRAAAVVDGRLGDTEGPLTQFEIATAVAFVALAEAGVEVAAIEAGLGGRLDASNVLDSQLTVLTSVGLEHVEWLGDTEEAIAAEKLAVLRPGTTLIVGPLAPKVLELARGHARAQGAALIEVVPDERAARSRAADLPGRFRRIDLEIARQAATFLAARLRPGADGPWSRADRAAAIVAELDLPGRLELWPGPIPVVFDVAHNPQGAAALAEAIPEVADGRPVYACLALLADKDAAGFAAALAPALRYVVCTELEAGLLRAGGRPGASSHPAADLAARFRERGIAAEAVAEPLAAIGRLRTKARSDGALALVTGSHYLVARARDRRLWHH